MSLGDFDSGAVIYGKFTTFNPSTGAPFTLAGTPALSVYKDNSTTQTTTGVTLTADFDSVTGLNHFAIDTSDSFYAVGSFFDVVITTGTVNAVSAVGSVVGRFTIRKTACLKPTTSGRTLDVDGGTAAANMTQVGGQTASASGTVTFPAATLASTTGAVGSVTGAVGSVTGNVGGNVVGSVGSVTGNVGGNVVGSVDSVADPVTVGTNNDKTGYSLATAPPTAVAIADAVLTTAMTESYRATNAAPTLAQALYEVIAHMGEASISGTTKTLKKIDGTTAKTFTLDSSTTPTSITETT